MSQIEQKFDVLIVGGGPGGLAAAAWCADLGASAVLIEKEKEFGGQMLWTYNQITNYPGIEPVAAVTLRNRFLAQIESTNTVKLSMTEVMKFSATEKLVITSDGTLYRGQTVIFATGVRRRRLNVAGESEFEGRGVLKSGAGQSTEISGKCVVIIGGGDAAIENALILGEKAASVHVIHRRPEFTARQGFMDRVKANRRIQISRNTIVTAIRGNKNAESVEVENVLSNEKKTIKADAVLIRIGVIPNTELLRGQTALDPKGYVIVNRRCETSVPGVFAIGDVANPESPTIISAAGQAATAVKNALKFMS